MMTKYYLTNDLNQNFEQEIHKEICLFVPNKVGKTSLGKFKSPIDTLESGKKILIK